MENKLNDRFEMDTGLKSKAITRKTNEKRRSEEKEKLNEKLYYEKIIKKFHVANHKW